MSSYRQIDGVKYDKGMLECAEDAVKGEGDGRISVEDAKKLLKETIDGNQYTDTEKTTMKYIRENFKFTEAADTFLRKAIASWASKKAAKKRTAEQKDGANKKAKKGPPELCADLKAKLEEYRAERKFDAAKWTQEKCTLFNDYMRKCGLKGCLVSVSGGVDSAVTLALMKKAASMENSTIERVAGVCQPIHSSAWALNRGRECCEKLGAEMFVVDQTELHSQLQKVVDGAVGIEGKPFATGQLRSYMRTPVGYYVAQLLSQNGTPCVVMGTGNMDEDGYLAYFCKAGDGVVDVQLLADIHKSEVFAVGRELGVPDSILDAAPSADLWDGQTDEEELGFTYDFIELFTGSYLKKDEAGQKAFIKSLGAEGKKQFDEWSKVAISVHNRNKHKFDSPHNINIF